MFFFEGVNAVRLPGLVPELLDRSQASSDKSFDFFLFFFPTPRCQDEIKWLMGSRRARNALIRPFREPAFQTRVFFVIFSSRSEIHF